MNETYLPGNARERILDLMKHGKVTQKDLAQRIDITESALSRFLSGATDRLDSEYLLRIARCFGVSTDFLLGETAVPDRKNYEIVELGLSAQAARNLYTGRVCADVVNRLLESPRFAELTFLLQRYFAGTLAQGYAAHNELLATLSDAVLSGTESKNTAKKAAQEIKRSKLPVYQADLTQIQNQFLAAVTEVKKEYTVDFTATQAMTKEVTEKMFAELTKGQDLPDVNVRPAFRWPGNSAFRTFPLGFSRSLASPSWSLLRCLHSSFSCSGSAYGSRRKPLSACHHAWVKMGQPSG